MNESVTEFTVVSGECNGRNSRKATECWLLHKQRIFVPHCIMRQLKYGFIGTDAAVSQLPYRLGEENCIEERVFFMCE